MRGAQKTDWYVAGLGYSRDFKADKETRTWKNRLRRNEKERQKRRWNAENKEKLKN